MMRQSGALSVNGNPELRNLTRILDARAPSHNRATLEIVSERWKDFGKLNPFE